MGLFGNFLLEAAYDAPEAIGSSAGHDNKADPAINGTCNYY